jgi:hypothetical protein
VLFTSSCATKQILTALPWSLQSTFQARSFASHPPQLSQVDRRFDGPPNRTDAFIPKARCVCANRKA